MRWLFVSLMLLCSLGTPPLAAPAAAEWPALSDVPSIAPTGANDVAVIVAVEDYLFLPDVNGAVANANDWELFFRNGLKIPTVHVLANQEATREEILRFAKTAADDVKPGGTIWWVFIGHGAPAKAGDDGLIVGVDAQQNAQSLEARGVPQKVLLDALKKETARTIMVVDACFSGRASQGEALAAGLQPVIAVDAAVSLAPTSVVLSAAKASEFAGDLPGTGRPAFSYLVLGALRGWADDGDGSVTAAEALHYAQRQMRGIKGRTQTPQGSGNLGVVLTSGVAEDKPKMVEEGIESALQCPEGQEKRGEQCVAVKSEGEGTSSSDGEAERTLTYLQERLVFEGRVVRQAGRVLDGPAFYHAIGRPDLAEKWRSHNMAMWIPGIVATVGGVALMVYGISVASSDSASRSAQTGWFIGGTLGGFFLMGGGISLITFGFVFDNEPMSFAQRKSAAEAHNQKLRDKYRLGPEVDWQNQPSRRGGFNIFGANEYRTPSFGVTVRF